MPSSSIEELPYTCFRTSGTFFEMGGLVQTRKVYSKRSVNGRGTWGPGARLRATGGVQGMKPPETAFRHLNIVTWTYFETFLQHCILSKLTKVIID